MSPPTSGNIFGGHIHLPLSEINKALDISELLMSFGAGAYRCCTVGPTLNCIPLAALVSRPAPQRSEAFEIQ